MRVQVRSRLQRPEMRFVEPKTKDQQARAALFRSRERLVRHRTEMVNALRGTLYEHGQSFPTGIRHLSRIQALLDDPENGLHPLVQRECLELIEQIVQTTERIDAKIKQATTLSAQSDVTRRLQTIPGIGQGNRLNTLWLSGRVAKQSESAGFSVASSKKDVLISYIATLGSA